MSMSVQRGHTIATSMRTVITQVSASAWQCEEGAVQCVIWGVLQLEATVVSVMPASTVGYFFGIWCTALGPDVWGLFCR